MEERGGIGEIPTGPPAASNAGTRQGMPFQLDARAHGPFAGWDLEDDESRRIKKEEGSVLVMCGEGVEA